MEIVFYIAHVFIGAIIIIALIKCIQLVFFEGKIATFTVSSETAKLFRKGDMVIIGKKKYIVMSVENDKLRIKRKYEWTIW